MNNMQYTVSRTLWIKDLESEWINDWEPESLTFRENVSKEKFTELLNEVMQEDLVLDYKNTKIKAKVNSLELSETDNGYFLYIL